MNPKDMLKGAKSSIDDAGMKELVARTFTTRNLLHFSHWSTGSYAAHQAVGGMYDDIISKVDSIVEAFMGKNGKLIIEGQPACSMPKCICEHIKQEAAWMCNNKENISKGSAPVRNMLDDLEGLYDSTVYKLENLT